MIGIVKKDLLTTRFYATIYFLCSLCYVGTYFIIKEFIFQSEIKGTGFSRTFLSIFPLILITEFNCKSFHYDRLGKNFEKYLNALPLSTKKIVLSKYISSAVFSTYGLVISLLCMTLFTKADGLPLSMSIYTNIWITYFIILIMLFFQMPVLVYNGNELLSFLVPAVCLSLPFGILVIINNLDINAAILSISIFFNNHAVFSDNLPLIILIIVLAAGVISFYISGQIYKRREF